MSLSITDPRGNFVNKQKDVLNIADIAYTAELGTINSAGFELFTTKGWPRSLATTNKMIKIRTATYFSNRLFRIGDRIIIKNITKPIECERALAYLENLKFFNQQTNNITNKIIQMKPIVTELDKTGISQEFNKISDEYAFIEDGKNMNNLAKQLSALRDE